MNKFKSISEVHLIISISGKILMSRRYNTGYEDGKYSLVAGHVDGNESLTEAMTREAFEEAGLSIKPKDLQLFHVSHRLAKVERTSFFFSADKWSGTPTNMEPDKCDDLSWFDLASLPSNTIPYVRSAIENGQKGQVYSEHGWEMRDRQ